MKDVPVEPVQPDESLPPDWVQRKLAALRARLEGTGERQEEVERLWEHIIQSGMEGPLAGEDEQMLSLMVDEALEGVDIAKRYPGFFRKLLANSDLREAFLDALDILERSRADQLEALPDPPSRDLAFLRAVAAQSVLEDMGDGGWRVGWRLAQTQLQALFFPAGLAEAYRDSEALLEEVYLTLLRDAVGIGETQLDVLLEATQRDEDLEALHLLLTVAVTGPPSEARPPGPLQATLQWGSYRETAAVDKTGQAAFPPVPRSVFLDEAGQVVTAGLQLSLEPAGA